MAIPPKVYNQHPRARGMRPGFVPALSGILEGTPCEGGGSSRAARFRQAVNTCGEGVCPGFVRRLSRVCPDFAFRRAATPACCFGRDLPFRNQERKNFQAPQFSTENSTGRAIDFCPIRESEPAIRVDQKRSKKGLRRARGGRLAPKDPRMCSRPGSRVRTREGRHAGALVRAHGAGGREQARAGVCRLDSTAWRRAACLCAF